jgi:hypothetical protein
MRCQDEAAPNDLSVATSETISTIGDFNSGTHRREGERVRIFGLGSNLSRVGAIRIEAGWLGLCWMHPIAQPRGVRAPGGGFDSG